MANAKQDNNQNFSLIGISGTLGPTYGTAETVPLTVNEQGQLRVESSASLTVGTIAEVTNLAGGTIGSVLGVGGVVQVSGTVATGGAGTQPVRIIDGTVTNVGTLVGAGTLTNVGSLTNVGTIKEITNIAGGTIAVTGGGDGAIQDGADSGIEATVFDYTDSNPLAVRLTDTNGGYYEPALESGGNLDNLSGIVHTLGNGFSSTDSGNLSLSVRNDAGTALSASDLDYLPVSTDATGAIWTHPKTGTLASVASVGTVVGAGTLTNVGSLTNIGTIKEITNIAGGTVVSALALNSGTITTIAAGTQNTLGTVGTILGIGGTVQVAGASAGTVVEINKGTINLGTVVVSTLPSGGTLLNLASGTLASLGTLPGVGVVTAVTNLAAGTLGVLAKGTIAVGTMVGATASGGTPTTNPVLVAGTDATGTVYAPLIGSTGGLLIDSITTIAAGVLDSVTSVASVGTVDGIGGTVQVNNVSGTQNTIGTIGTIPGVGIVTRIGNIGTIESGTVTTSLALNTGTITTIAAGTQNTLGTVGTVIGAGTLTNVGSLTNIGTIKEVANLVTGTIAAVTSVGEVVKGTTTLVTRTGNLGTLELGSVVVTTLPSGGTILNLATGTLASVGTVPGVGVVSNLTSGSVVVTSGTLGSVVAVAQVHNAGTIQAGTVQINPVPVPELTYFGTMGTAGGSFFATISAASGAGTKHYISGLSVIGSAGTTCVRILAGTAIQGTGVLGAGIIVPGGGFVRDFSVPLATGTNSEITYHFTGAGSAFICIDYWKGV